MKRLNQLMLSAVLLSGFCLPAFGVTFEQAIATYQNQQFEQAQRAFKELAQLGNTKAQLNIAVMYIRGEHFEKDFIEAYAWAALAHDNGDDAAENVMLAIAKAVTPADVEKSQQRLEQLKVQYGAEAIAKRLKPTFTGHSGAVKPARALVSKIPDYPRSMARRGRFGWVDVEFSVDKDGSTRYFKVLSSPDDEFSEAALEAVRGSRFEPAEFSQKTVLTMGATYRYLFNMSGAKLKREKLVDFLAEQKEKAIDGGAEDKRAYAFILDGLQSAVSHYENAADVTWDNSGEWYFKAAQNGSPLAKYALGTSMLTGKQCDVAVDKSLFWLEEAAKDNVLDAKLALGYEYLVGNRFEKNAEKGFALITEAARLGFDHAQVFAAWLLSTYPDDQYRNYQQAHEFLQQVDDKSYVDSRSLWEARVATALRVGDWNSAQKWLKKLVKYNEKYGQSPDRVVALQRALSQKEAYIERL